MKFLNFLPSGFAVLAVLFKSCMSYTSAAQVIYEKGMTRGIVAAKIVSTNDLAKTILLAVVAAIVGWLVKAGLEYLQRKFNLFKPKSSRRRK